MGVLFMILSIASLFVSVKAAGVFVLFPLEEFFFVAFAFEIAVHSWHKVLDVGFGFSEERFLGFLDDGLVFFEMVRLCAVDGDDFETGFFSKVFDCLFCLGMADDDYLVFGLKVFFDFFE